MKNIVLTGFMGTGKTVVGRRLAHRLKREFIDTDAEIESLMGKTVTEIFAIDGIVLFRSKEELLAKKLSKRHGLVIATGGGMVLNPVNLELLKENGILVALTASPEIIYTRVKDKKNRPLLLDGDIKSKIKGLLRERENVYKEAEITIDTSLCRIDETVEKIISCLIESNHLYN